MHKLIAEKGYVSPLDLLLRMGKISPELVEEWRFSRIPYLERVIHGNLSQLNFILSKLRENARELKLKESTTVYKSWGKGRKRVLRFSKSGDPHTERRYATHYVKSRPIARIAESDQTEAKSNETELIAKEEPV